MKYTYVILKVTLLLTLTPVFSQNRSGEVIYRVTDSPYLKENSKKKNKKMTQTRRRVKERFRMSKEKLKELRWKLIFSNDKSIFKVVPMMGISKKEESYIRLAKILVSTRKSYSTDIQKKEIIIERNFDYENYLVVKPIDVSKWKMTSNTKKIGEYLCYEATLEEEFTTYKGELKTRTQRVWYTPQIPVSFGPKDFAGFPGLILEITDKGTTLTASKIVLNKKEKVDIEPPKKGKRISEEEMKKVLKEYRENNMMIIKSIRNRKKNR